MHHGWIPGPLRIPGLPLTEGGLLPRSRAATRRPSPRAFGSEASVGGSPLDPYVARSYCRVFGLDAQARLERPTLDPKPDLGSGSARQEPGALPVRPRFTLSSARHPVNVKGPARGRRPDRPSRASVTHRAEEDGAVHPKTIALPPRDTIAEGPPRLLSRVSPTFL